MAVLLTACSGEASDGQPSSQPVEPLSSPTALPTEGTGAIDLSSLRGRIAFGTGADIEDTKVYVIEADGSAPTRLTSNNVADFDPSWSPDGSRIVFRYAPRRVRAHSVSD